MLHISNTFSMTTFNIQFDRYSADWNLNLALAIYMHGTPYNNDELNHISATFDTLVHNLKTMFSMSFNTTSWDGRLQHMLQHCNNFVTGFIHSIDIAKPHSSFLLPTLHIYFASLYASCVTAYFCVVE